MKHWWLWLANLPWLREITVSPDEWNIANPLCHFKPGYGFNFNISLRRRVQWCWRPLHRSVLNHFFTCLYFREKDSQIIRVRRVNMSSAVSYESYPFLAFKKVLRMKLWLSISPVSSVVLFVLTVKKKKKTDRIFFVSLFIGTDFFFSFQRQAVPSLIEPISQSCSSVITCWQRCEVDSRPSICGQDVSTYGHWAETSPAQGRKESLTSVFVSVCCFNMFFFFYVLFTNKFKWGNCSVEKDTTDQFNWAWIQIHRAAFILCLLDKSSVHFIFMQHFYLWPQILFKSPLQKNVIILHHEAERD